jgi:glutamate carboxypeptidase
MALQIERIAKMSQPRRGITVSPTVAQGGIRSNVIPADARIEVDLRALRLSDMRSIERRLRALKPALQGTRIEVSGGFSRPPLERGASAELFKHARHIASEIGLTLGETSSGGGSDGNFTAALGIPTLDGLGAVGEGAHSSTENVVVQSLPERAALLAGMLATL